MEGDAVLAIIEAHGPAPVGEIVRLLALEGIDATVAETSAALRRLEALKKVACTPRDNWRLAGETARRHSEHARQAAESAVRGKRTRALIYCPEILRDVPAFERNTLLHFVAHEEGGFRLRDYTGGHRIEVDEVAGINKTVFLEAAYHWTQFDFDEEEAATSLTDNAFWEKRIAEANEAHAALLAKGEPVIKRGGKAR